MKMNPVVHFEMPYTDPKRVSAFYQSAFGWVMRYFPKMGNYVLATTSPVDKNQMHKKKGAINGGFFPKGDYGQKPHLVITVDDLSKHMVIVKKSGGKITGKPMDIPGVGTFVMIRDTEGNRVGMLQPVQM
jgi:predicted enzyme related to lactoylglutathione lyase